MNIIDRRLNPQGKSLPNRQRFLRRAREHIVKAVRNVSSKRSIQDIENGDNVTIPSDGIREPQFRKAARGGIRDIVLPGNKHFIEGDTIPRSEDGSAGSGSGGSSDGEGEDQFRFVLSREEFINIFLEDLELPDLIKQKLKQTEALALTRAGFSVTGAPANLNVTRTLRNSLSRRIALRRPGKDELERMLAEIVALESSGDDPERLTSLRADYERLRRRAMIIPYIDPVDVRYNRFQVVPKPIAQAVMFCLMDVSGSMTEGMKDLAKRFFVLLYLFLTRRYRSVEIVFIRHTHEAKEVDEQTFFYSAETGGTVVSTALEEMERVIKSRYPANEWNIYAAQASDGDNMISDNPRAVALLRDGILPICQYFAYIEIDGGSSLFPRSTGRETELWRTYRALVQESGPLVMRRVQSQNDIFPVFRDLFTRNRAAHAP